MQVGTIHLCEFTAFVWKTHIVRLHDGDIIEIMERVAEAPSKPNDVHILFKGGVVFIVLPPNLGEDSEDDNDSAWPIVEGANGGNHPVIVITYGNAAQNYYNNHHMDNARNKGYFTIGTLTGCSGAPYPMYTNVYALRRMTDEEQREQDDRMALEYSPFDASLRPTETPPHLDL